MRMSGGNEIHRESQRMRGGGRRPRKEGSHPSSHRHHLQHTHQNPSTPPTHTPHPTQSTPTPLVQAQVERSEEYNGRKKQSEKNQDVCNTGSRIKFDMGYTATTLRLIV